MISHSVQTVKEHVSDEESSDSADEERDQDWIELAKYQKEGFPEGFSREKKGLIWEDTPRRVLCQAHDLTQEEKPKSCLTVWEQKRDGIYVAPSWVPISMLLASKFEHIYWNFRSTSSNRNTSL